MHGQGFTSREIFFHRRTGSQQSSFLRGHIELYVHLARAAKVVQLVQQVIAQQSTGSKRFRFRDQMRMVTW